MGMVSQVQSYENQQQMTAASTTAAPAPTAAAMGESVMAAQPNLPPRDTPYLEARREYSDRYANLAAGRRNWQLAAFCAFVIAAMCSAVAFIQVRKPAEVPYVVMLDRSDGYAITFPTSPAASATAIDMGQVEQQTVAAFIRSARAVVADMRGEDDLMNFVKYHATGKAEADLTDYFMSKEHRPYLVSRDHSVSPTIASLIGVGVHTWQVRWTETKFDRQGHEISGETPEHWVAIVHTIVNPKEGHALVNPFGIYVDVVQWTREDLPGEGQH
jgi:type IV secretion system protein VirB5